MKMKMKMNMTMTMTMKLFVLFFLMVQIRAREAPLFSSSNVEIESSPSHSQYFTTKSGVGETSPSSSTNFNTQLPSISSENDPETSPSPSTDLTTENLSFYIDAFGKWHLIIDFGSHPPTALP